MTHSFPSTLHTPTLAEGHALARQLAQAALRPNAAPTMADHLKTATPPPLEQLTAAYFLSVAAANAGWHR